MLPILREHGYRVLEASNGIAALEHLTIEANGASFHVAPTGAGRPLLLLHGWPEFWLSWEPVMKRLSDRYTLIAADLRGFGDSAKPAGPFGPADHAADMLALLEMAPGLVGATRDSCRTFIAHFLRHWSHRREAFDDVIEAFTDNFLKPGNLAGGFAHYRAAHAARLRMMKGEAPLLPAITAPTCLRWPGHDPLFPYDWTDRLGASFSDLDLALFRASDTFPIAKILIAPQPRSRPPSSAWVGADILA